jgi:hypothetical protein
MSCCQHFDRVDAAMSAIEHPGGHGFGRITDCGWSARDVGGVSCSHEVQLPQNIITIAPAREARVPAKEGVANEVGERTTTSRW